VVDHRYDAFVSYSHLEPDRSWVRGDLAPALTAAGLRLCVDHRCFRLGAPVVLEMERAVLESRHTVAVMTPNYLASNFTQLENVLAETLGLERSEHRLLVLVREPCDIPLRVRARLYLDMTADATFDDDLATLVAALRASSEP
jgi:hypothetical protein